MTGNITVLVIDDEPNNLRALQIDMEDESYNVLTANDGVQGWDVLNERKDSIHAILLDRMMPNMDGMEFLRKVKATDSLKNIPIIMQTAAAEKEQIVEGINEGAYYYITKPYDKSIMLAIVKAAIHEHLQAIKIKEELGIFKSKLYLINESNFEVRSIDEVDHVSTFLANFFPEPENTVSGIRELITNAIEHGNLGVSYDTKSELIKDGTWMDEVRRRSELPENKDKKVSINYINNKEEIILTIKDEGEGFDWNKYLEISPNRATHSHGRGIALARMISFDSVEYKGNGNEIVCKVKLPTDKA